VLTAVECKTVANAATAAEIPVGTPSADSGRRFALEWFTSRVMTGEAVIAIASGIAARTGIRFSSPRES